MSNIVNVRGIVAAETDYNENDKMLTVISAENGKMSVSAKGAKKPNSRFLSCAQLFCYSDMTLYCGKNGVYTLSECSLINSFYDLRNDYDVLVDAVDISKLALKVSQEECEDPELMRLLLNTLYFLAKGEKDRNLLKCIFKIRLVYEQGFLDTENVDLNTAFGKAVKHIAGSDMKKLFSFTVSDEVVKELKAYAEKAVNGMLECV